MRKQSFLEKADVEDCRAVQTVLDLEHTISETLRPLTRGLFRFREHASRAFEQFANHRFVSNSPVGKPVGSSRVWDISANIEGVQVLQRGVIRETVAHRGRDSSSAGSVGESSIFMVEERLKELSGRFRAFKREGSHASQDQGRLHGPISLVYHHLRGVFFDVQRNPGLRIRRAKLWV